MSFLPLLNDRKRIMAKLMVEKDDITLLDRLMAVEDDHIIQAYEDWKTKRTAQVDPADPSHPTPNSPSFDIVSITENPRSQRLQESSSSSSFIRGESVTNMPDVPPDLFERLPKELTVVFLGETGVGKSTFVNGMVNYLKYATLHEAQERGVEILIKASFTHTDSAYETLEVKCEPTVKIERTLNEENEDTDAGQSSTQHPKSYKFIWSYGDEERVIRIIDTPGVGDVRGVPQEMENFRRTLSFLADFKKINAICILLHPNHSRLTLGFRYCINELLSHFHISAARNILFCFTNARSTLYRPGETLPSLKAHLKGLNQEKGIGITLNEKTMFCFDNESFRLLCAMNAGANFKDQEKKSFNDSWVKSVEETFRLFGRIAELEPHDVDKTLSVNNIRSVILAMGRPLAEIAKNQLQNSKLIQERIQELEDCMRRGADLKGKLNVDQVKIVLVKIDYPMTVCTAGKCVEYMRFDSDPNSKVETVYVTECHKNCYMMGVDIERLPNPNLQRCKALYKNINQCSNCGCPWTTHMHIRYKLNKVQEKVTDPTVQQSINRNEDVIKAAKLFIEKQKKKRDELLEESKKIAEYYSEFVIFLKTNSIIPYNDAYQDYVTQLIKEEKNKDIANNKMLAELEKYKEEYAEQVKLLEDGQKSKKSTKRAKTIDEIYEMVDDLKKLRHCGKLLEEIQNLELLSVREQQKYQSTSVSLHGGWLDRFSPQKFGKRVS